MTNEDAISREAVIRLVEQYPNIIGNRYSGLIADIKHLPPITPNKEIVEDKRACEKCIHYVSRDSGRVVLCGCDSWECDFEEVKT